jgi:hypothetical protein
LHRILKNKKKERGGKKVQVLKISKKELSVGLPRKDAVFVPSGL